MAYNLTQDQIHHMRTGGKILAETLLYLQEKTVPGITTEALNSYTKERFLARKVTPAFLGYNGFSGSVCISINEEVIHGVPKSDKVIQEGDIVSLDCGLIYQGMIVDAAISFGVGQIPEDSRLLIERTKKSLYKGISVLRDGSMTGDYGYAVEQYINQFGYGIIRDYAGHGVGLSVHEDPTIPNYGAKGSGVRLTSGMTIALEPMVTLGGEDVYIDEADDWTVITEDHSLSAHYEHTVLITKQGAEILTQI